MFTIDINPVLVSLGPFEIRYYGLVFVLGFLIVLVVLQRATKKNRIDMSKDQTYDLVFYLMIGVLIGARIFHIVFWDLDYYMKNLIKIFYIWEGGLSVHGGLLGGILSVYLFTKKHKLNFWKIADLLIIPAILMLAFGRIANFINQEILGTITNVSWCVKFLGADPLYCRHPVQLYAALGRFSLFFFLLTLKDKYKDGFVFWNFIFLLSIGRFILDFIREDIRYMGLSAGQWLSILMILFGGYVLFRFYREDLKYSFWFKKKEEN